MSLSVIDNHIMLPSVHCSVCPRFYEYHIHLVGIEKFYSISSFTESGFAEFHDLSGSTFFQDISFSWFCNIERVAVIRYFGTHIVNQNATRPNKISVKIFNFEVVSLNWFSTLFSSDSINICLSIVRIDETAQIRIVVPATQIVQTGFFVKDIPAIPEGLQRAQCSCQGASLADHLTPSIVSIRYHFGAVAVNQTNDIALQANS